MKQPVSKVSKDQIKSAPQQQIGSIKIIKDKRQILLKCSNKPSEQVYASKSKFSKESSSNNNKNNKNTVYSN